MYVVSKIISTTVYLNEDSEVEYNLFDKNAFIILNNLNNDSPRANQPSN